MAESEPPRFNVGMSGDVRAQLLRCQAKALDVGAGREFLAALRRINSRLEAEADQFGEPIFDLPNMQAQMRHVLDCPISLVYAVHYRRPEVFLHSFVLVPPAT